MPCRRMQCLSREGRGDNDADSLRDCSNSPGVRCRIGGSLSDIGGSRSDISGSRSDIGGNCSDIGRCRGQRG